jgi:hypothetical protein
MEDPQIHGAIEAREAGLEPDTAAARDPGAVENYEQ